MFTLRVFTVFLHRPFTPPVYTTSLLHDITACLNVGYNVFTLLHFQGSSTSLVLLLVVFGQP